MIPERPHRQTHRHDERDYHEPTIEEQVEANPSLLDDARQYVADLDLPTTPDVARARILQVESFPTWCGSRKVHDVRITEGEPMHGEKRSDDHVSRFDIEAPAVEFEVPVDTYYNEGYNEEWLSACPECGHTRFRYRYNAHHHIAGSESLYCANCEELIHSEEWG